MVESLSQLQNLEWPARAQHYRLAIPIGMGSFGLVWKAEVLKEGFDGRNIIDLEQFQDNSIDEIRKEISVMSTCQHKNVVSCYVSFIEGTDLWLVMPINFKIRLSLLQKSRVLSLLSAGSCSDILKLNFPQGVKDEAIIATIVKETLLGLQYFHENRQIHRDIKAGNILLDMEGNVYISDFGVSASLKKGQKRKTFVGSPCWMAPEVMEQTGHDFSADIWSLGITAIELANGEAPYQQLPAMKVILQIMNNAPPTLNKHDKWDQSFRDFVNDCLQKDASRRPTIDQIFKSHKKFFAKARTATYLATNFIQDLPEVFLRKDSSLIYQAEDYLSSKVKQKVKRVESDMKNPIQWDLESGDYTDMVRQEKAKAKKGKAKRQDEDQQDNRNGGSRKEPKYEAAHQINPVNKNQARTGDTDDLFDDLGEEES